MSLTAGEQAVEGLRDLKRKEMDQSRRQSRYRISTVQRSGLDSYAKSKKYAADDLTTMAVSLKKKKAITRQFLAELSQAIAENEANASAFIAVDGALQALCSFLTGNAWLIYFTI